MRNAPMPSKRPRDKRKSTESSSDILRLARVMHDRLRDLEGGGHDVALTPAVEELLAVDPTYTPRNPSVKPNANPLLSAVGTAARLLRTSIPALMGEQPHTPVYTAPPSKAEEERHRIHRDGGSNPTPFTVLSFPADGDVKAQAFIAELPIVYAVADSEHEALEALREALDAVLIRAYETTTAKIDTRGRAYKQAPFPFQPPAAGRVR
jgi:predicted RNase H-like HicB family nuclease